MKMNLSGNILMIVNDKSYHIHLENIRKCDSFTVCGMKCNMTKINRPFHSAVSIDVEQKERGKFANKECIQKRGGFPWV